MNDHDCKRCGGVGRRAYATTSTWHGGIGGCAITEDVCDQCWGSGSESAPWKSHRELFAEMKALRAERDALKARVEELENTIDCGCNALTDSICCSGNDADTNLGFVRKMKRVLIGNNNTTPGGDDGK